MTTMRQICVLIRKRRRGGISDSKIAKELNVSKPEIGRLANNKYPGEKVARQLGIPVICHACHRKVKDGIHKQTKPVQDYQLWWRKLLPSDRDRMIQNLFELEGPK